MSPLLDPATSPLDERARAVVARMADAERARILELPSNDPLDPVLRRRVQATGPELFGQPDAIRNTLSCNSSSLNTVTNALDGKISRVVLAGCGDSLAVMQAARAMLEYAFGVPCEPRQSLEFAYYDHAGLGPNTAVIALSSSGETTRTVEAVLMARQGGSYTVAVTNTPNSTLVAQADAALHVEATRVGWPTQSTTAALALLYELGLRVAERHGRPDVGRLGQALDDIPRAMAQALTRLNGPVADIAAAEVAAGVDHVLFAGAGPNLGTAIVGAAKVKECTTLHASDIQLEEYHHYNSQKAGEPLMIFAPSGPSVPRAVDTATDALRWGGRLYVVTTEGEGAFDDFDATVLTLPAVPEALSPLLYVVVAQLFGYHLGLRAMPRRWPVPDETELLCVGNLTVDEVVGPDGRRTESLGGDALFAALAARWAGGRPAIMAPLGNDAGARLRAAIRAAGTEPDSLPHRDLPTVRNVVVHERPGTRRWTTVHGYEHFEQMSPRPTDFTDDALNVPAILLSGMAIDAQLELSRWIPPRTGATLYFDPQEDYLAGHEAVLREAIARCDVFLPSAVEAKALGADDLGEAVATFLELGPHTVVVKLAAAGCLVATRERPEPTLVPAAPATVVDDTGAGDAFCGAFAVAHQRSGDPHAAAVTAMAAARTAIHGPGIDALLDAVGGLVR